jgi:hypothetical protein
VTAPPIASDPARETSSRDAQQPVTTDGRIALANLEAQIGMVESAGPRAPALGLSRLAVLVDLLLLRGHVRGRIVDYERAIELADRMVLAASSDPAVFMARARARATLHLFSDAIADLQEAGRRGAAQQDVDVEQAAILQALGCLDQARILLGRSVLTRRGFTGSGASATLAAERGDLAEADDLFAEARAQYRGVSPFPLAQMDFQRGVMWMRAGRDDHARRWLSAAHERLPGYVAAAGHLAEVELRNGEAHSAAARLRPLTGVSDDPEYGATLAQALAVLGRSAESEAEVAAAAVRYDELVEAHPAAYADHAVVFWLGVGNDPGKAFEIAIRLLAMRQTARSRDLADRAALAVAGLG